VRSCEQAPSLASEPEREGETGPEAGVIASAEPVPRALVKTPDRTIEIVQQLLQVPLDAVAVRPNVALETDQVIAAVFKLPALG
jgi:hypothetical protein